jgi:hypothetical protein
MSGNVVNFPIIPRPVVYVTPQDERDPHTAAIEMFKKFMQFSRRENGDAWTFRLINGSLEVADTNGWKQRERSLLNGEKK